MKERKKGGIKDFSKLNIAFHNYISLFFEIFNGARRLEHYMIIRIEM